MSASQLAAFAISSRIISCLVTESLLRAFYVPLSPSTDATRGLLVVLSPSLFNEGLVIHRTLRSQDIFAIVPLHNVPVLKEATAHKHGYVVGLVDPLDMIGDIYDVVDVEDAESVSGPFTELVKQTLRPPPWDIGTFSLRLVQNPVPLWRKFVANMVIQDTTIEQEIQSSFYWQQKSYENPPACPTLASPPLEWEQSLVEGHPTHPMHRARMLPSAESDYDWYHPKIRFARVPRENFKTLGPFETLTRELAEKAAAASGESITPDDSKVLIPVHEMQINNFVSKFPEADVLGPNISVQAHGQSSIRTVIVPELPGMALKLAIGVKISSCLRTISHYTVNFGPRFSTEVVPRLTLDPKILHIETEPASFVFGNVDPEIAKHSTAIYRNVYQPSEGENVIVVAALLERGHVGIAPGVSVVEHLFSLDTDEKRVKFLDSYIGLACRSMLPPLIFNGVAFEAHAQNTLLRFNVETGELLGFVMRDLGGLRIHPPTLAESTGYDFEFLPGHQIPIDTRKEAYSKFYHTLIHNHLQRLIRLLGLHYDGRGWEILRHHLDKTIPAAHELRDAWLNPEQTKVHGKCLMRMRLQGLYRDVVYSPFPNMILYEGAPETVV